jgi:hypothetical protein
LTRLQLRTKISLGIFTAAFLILAIDTGIQSGRKTMTQEPIEVSEQGEIEVGFIRAVHITNQIMDVVPNRVQVRMIVIYEYRCGMNEISIMEMVICCVEAEECKRDQSGLGCITREPSGTNQTIINPVSKIVISVSGAQDTRAYDAFPSVLIYQRGRFGTIVAEFIEAFLCLFNKLGRQVLILQNA